MQFYEFATAYDHGKRMGIDVSHREFYSGVTDVFRSQVHSGDEQFRAEHNRGIFEWNYIDNGRPYYRVYPAVLDMLMHVGIDLPTSVLKLPFNVFCIRLPEEPRIWVNQEKNFYIRSFLVGENLINDHRSVYLWIDQNEFDQFGAEVITYSQLLCNNHTIEEAIDALPKQPTDLSDELNHNLVRLAVSVCFLATGSDRLISPDVLSKDLAAWLEAVRKSDGGRQKVIEDRARRRGKLGWNVGSRELVHSRSLKGDESGLGHQLSFQHQRSAHFRLLPSGSITFIRQATVRPDLPPKV